MARMKHPRSRLVSTNAYAPCSVPWVVRVSSPRLRGIPLLTRATLVALFTLVFHCAAHAQAPTGTAPDAVPVVSGIPAAKPAAKPAAVTSARTLPEAPRDLRKVAEWIDYRAARHIASMPTEARIFYRRGLNAKQAGQEEEALVNVRGAAMLDPLFVEPHLTIAAWMAILPA